jgi:hypothetical protein
MNTRYKHHVACVQQKLKILSTTWQKLKMNNNCIKSNHWMLVFVSTLHRVKLASTFLIM